MNLDGLPNPKLSTRSSGEWESLFPYYAGFSKDFADWLIDKFAAPTGARVFDPWNGAGTTTIAAAQRGLPAFGNDLNPVMAMVAKARAVARDSADLLLPLADLLIDNAARYDVIDDPLMEWFDLSTASTIRSIARSITNNASGGLKRLGILGDHVSAPTAVMYVALFAACRSILAPLRSSNPTWLKAAKSETEKISAKREQLVEEFRGAVLSATRHAYDHGLADQSLVPEIAVQDAAASSKVRADFILTSPPYCTRIDYAHLTKLELAILDESFSDNYGALRRALTGTALTGQAPARRPSNLTAKCHAFLDAVKTHRSRASAGYYYKSHLDYYAKMARALTRLANGLRERGTMVLVVQDSWYKDVHNDVAEILQELCEHRGLKTVDSRDFPVTRSLADVHKHRAAYRRERPTAESVMLFQKSARQ
jgi:hypothetical protein